MSSWALMHYKSYTFDSSATQDKNLVVGVGSAAKIGNYF